MTQFHQFMSDCLLFQIENEDLRKELQKKQELLCQAAKAIELIEESQRKQVESSSTTIKDLTEQIECLQVRFSHKNHININLIQFDEIGRHSLSYRMK